MVEQVDYVVIGLGALGSATAWSLARRGHRVVGLDRFELGHSRGASHDTSRILRHSYHTPAYVELTLEAYADWADLEEASGERLVTTVGGLDFFPPSPAISPDDYLASMDAVGIGYEALDAAEVSRRWPAFRVPEGTLTLHQADAAIVPAGRGTRIMQEQGRRHGADLRGNQPALGMVDHGAAGVTIETAEGTLKCRGVVITADAWTNDVLRHLDARVPLEVTEEQVTYFAPDEPERFGPEVMPLWIWMDDPSFYGFPTYGEPTLKSAQDCGGPPVDPDDRGDRRTDQAMLERLTARMGDLLPGSGDPVRSLRCLYTLTPDRDFVLAPVPGHERVVVGLGAAHAFKFAPTFGRLLTDLVTTGESATDLSAFRLDRPALTDPSYAANWLV
ncbi:N-methyl-L-tryptophan oxidase [Nocardioides sp.]|uniref:N-methyl-L-tryptophan oxidase n=1 Tax=Nocardioides sp. TaxID=35761 RepID=UPI0035687DEB